MQQALEDVVQRDEDGQCRTDVAVFAAFDDGAHLPHDDQRAEEDECAGNGQSEDRHLQEQVGHHGNHQDDAADGEEAAEGVGVNVGFSRHHRHNAEYRRSHQGCGGDEVRAAGNAQAVLQQRGYQCAHAEGENHQKACAHVAVAVFLNQENHAVEEGEEGDDARPAVAGEAEEVEARGGSGECAQRTGDEGHCQEAVGFAQNAVALHAHGRVGIVVNIMLHGVVPMCGLVNKNADCNSKS